MDDTVQYEVRWRFEGDCAYALFDGPFVDIVDARRCERRAFRNREGIETAVFEVTTSRRQLNPEEESPDA